MKQRLVRPKPSPKKQFAVANPNWDPMHRPKRLSTAAIGNWAER
uniref:Uncharacterized protein n=1 Tax=Romanomermis culicivorax TaxID=13658 RepID=A0A915JA78_ROMCU